MLSLRAQLVKKALQNSVKPLLSPTTSTELQRRVTDFGLQLNLLPLGTEITTTNIDGIPAEWITNRRQACSDSVILYLHGGAYSIGSAKSHRNLTAHLAKATGATILVLDYKLAPEFPFPAALTDATDAYQWLLKNGHQAQDIVIAGDSAGGGLALATALSLKDKHIPLPACLGLISPWVDMTMSGESVKSKADLDPMIREDWLNVMINNYAVDLPPESPLCSPIFADLEGLPPIHIQVGSDEILLDDALRLAQRAESQGITVNLEIWDEMWHVWHFQAGLVPEANQAIEQFAKLICPAS
ncbi:alpha/beta hydrolase [Litoribrevibacter euphylliae]|uniref:Alpha/beta hydrolase n=1 Tax=Litoribrevibacter euphylliae TaxID=1834034 RepID=A0ABV7HC73_9GAMM